MNARLRTAALLTLSLQLACASHSDKTKPIRSALDAGQDREALGLLNEALDVANAKQLPEDVKGENALYLLDRSIVLQALGDYALSSRDLEVSDKQIEVLDLSRNAAHDIGKYLYSDDVGPYKAPAYEKLMINTMNMVNYLARGDLNGARIEARRLAVMQKFLERSEGQGSGLLGLGSYLAGFTFEKSGKPDEALRYYDEALASGSYPSLEEPIRRLAERSSYRTPRLRRVLGDSTAAVGATGAETAPAASRTPATEATGSADDAELLVIIGYGRVPAKIARRIPIGLALTYASMYMSPADQATANRLALQGLVTWVNYPELGKARLGWTDARLAVDRRPQALDGILAVDAEARRAWDEAKGAVVASAITRMITRIVAGEAAGSVAKDNVVGALISLGTQATLTALDTPDTRSWETLPARIAVGRLRVPAGKHVIGMSANGATREKSVTLAPGGFAVTTLTVLR
jgi:tetratricopeptide (TPR) repeat protein